VEAWEVACLVLYGSTVAVLSVYGAHRYYLLRLFYRHRRQPARQPARFAELPRVTIQLPLYNEVHVVDRLLAAVGRIDYPRDRLEIQVLDDSQDETRDRARQAATHLAQQGFAIEYLGRPHREGFKAGALAQGLQRATGEFVLILDADFVPPPEILQQSIPYFTDPRVGMVQLRWGHLNRTYSLLTRIQSIFLDGHFVIEHTARSRAGRFFNFNGTAGVWRRRAIEEAGGWKPDTLTEDLDLSYRAQLAGWRFVFLPEVEVPGELPVEMDAFKAQQHRWTKGGVQTARKLLPQVWRSRVSSAIKVEATFHLTAHACYPLMLLMALLIPPVLSIRAHLGWERLLIVDLPLFAMAGLAISGFYLASQRALYPDWKAQIKYLPVLMALGLGLCVNNTRAVVEALLGSPGNFARTPKYGTAGQARGQRRYRSQHTALCLAELAMGLYFALALYQAWTSGLYLALPFLLLFHAGFVYTGLMSLLQGFVDRRRWALAT
jgi:cellulose synthase/poly-beta-1,6-N-acetylglucosamine synthase-like glycosyltransferase